MDGRAWYCFTIPSIVTISVFKLLSLCQLRRRSVPGNFLFKCAVKYPLFLTVVRVNAALDLLFRCSHTHRLTATDTIIHIQTHTYTQMHVSYPPSRTTDKQAHKMRKRSSQERTANDGRSDSMDGYLPAISDQQLAKGTAVKLARWRTCTASYNSATKKLPRTHSHQRTCRIGKRTKGPQAADRPRYPNELGYSSTDELVNCSQIYQANRFLLVLHPAFPTNNDDLAKSRMSLA